MEVIDDKPTVLGDFFPVFGDNPRSQLTATIESLQDENKLKWYIWFTIVPFPKLTWLNRFANLFRTKCHTQDTKCLSKFLHKH